MIISNDASTVVPKRWAAAYSNPKIIAVRTLSGFRATLGDPSGPTFIFGTEALNSELGDSILDCLGHSRFIREEKELQTLHSGREAAYSQFVEKLLLAGSYKTRRALFNMMVHCNIEKLDDKITIRPTFHRALEAWSGETFTAADSVVVSSDCSPTALGEALREAFRRCK